MDGYNTFVEIVKRAVFGLAVVAAVIALVDWLVRTRRVNPFGPIGRFSRRAFDPLMRPVERRIVRAGGQPSNAPWWTLAVVVIGGLLLVTLLQVTAFVLKLVFFTWLQVVIRWTLPRFRYDQLMRLGWQGLLPVSLVNVVVSALVIVTPAQSNVLVVGMALRRT